MKLIQIGNQVIEQQNHVNTQIKETYKKKVCRKSPNLSQIGHLTREIDVGSSEEIDRETEKDDRNFKTNDQYSFHGLKQNID